MNGENSTSAFLSERVEALTRENVRLQRESKAFRVERDIYKAQIAAIANSLESSGMNDLASEIRNGAGIKRREEVGDGC